MTVGTEGSRWVCVHQGCRLEGVAIDPVPNPLTCPSCGMQLERIEWTHWIDVTYERFRVTCRNCGGGGCSRCEGIGTVEVVGERIRPFP